MAKGKSSKPIDIKDQRKLRNAAALQERIDKIRKSQVGHGVEYYVLAGELAARLGVDVGDVMDDFSHQAAIRQYEGGITMQESERLGWAATEEIYTRQRRLTA
jgi:hypothetical protein